MINIYIRQPQAILKDGCLDSVDWNGGMEWNGNKLGSYDWFSPPYDDHL